ncbi:MAG: hypothetical protein RIG77_17340 [Cyclobacteriaceae bacterium]
MRTYESIEVSGSTSELANILADNVIVTFSDATDTLSKEDLLLNHEFNSSYNPWNEIISIAELNDSTVEVQALETNELLSYWELDTVGYLTRYTLSNHKISGILMDTIPNSEFQYRKTDSLYNLRLAELFDWMSLMYPDEYEQIGELTSESSKLILQMAKEKGR